MRNSIVLVVATTLLMCRTSDSVLLTSVDDDFTFTKCEQEMISSSTASNNLWVNEIARFYSIPRNVDRPFDITFYVRCNGEKINRLDPGCKFINGLINDAANTWFRYIKNYLPLRINVVDSSNDVNATWINRRKGVDVNFPDSKKDHTDFGFTCPFKPSTLAHASAILLHVNMLHTWSLPNDLTQNTYDIYSTLLHEVGHVFGLPHTTERNSIMFPSIKQSERKTLSANDYKTFERLYEKAINERYRQKQFLQDKQRDQQKPSVNNEEMLVRRVTQLVLYKLQRALYEAQRQQLN